MNQIGDSVTGHLSYSILPFLPSLSVDRDVFFPDIIFEGFFGKDCGALSRATRHRLRRSMLFALKVVELLLSFPSEPPAKVRCKVFNSRRTQKTVDKRLCLNIWQGPKILHKCCARAPKGEKNLCLKTFLRKRGNFSMETISLILTIEMSLMFRGV